MTSKIILTFDLIKYLTKILYMIYLLYKVKTDRLSVDNFIRIIINKNIWKIKKIF